MELHEILMIFRVAIRHGAQFFHIIIRCIITFVDKKMNLLIWNEESPFQDKDLIFHKYKNEYSNMANSYHSLFDGMQF